MLFAIVFAAAFFALYTQASAATTCAAAAAISDSNDPLYTASLDVTGFVTPTDGCELGSTNNDSQVPLQVNVDTVFGHSNWQFAEKLQEDDDEIPLNDNSEEAIDIGLRLSGNDPQSGTWFIDDVWSLYDAIMLVFKGGNGQNINPDVYVAYLLTEGATTGAYNTPFRNGTNLADISHISAYVIPTVVPLPAALPLFGAALLGMGLYGRRRRRAEAS